MKGNKSKLSPFSKDSFYYDEETDQFLCPCGEILSRKGEYEYNGKQVYAYYGANCGECPFRLECAGEGKIRTITSDGYEGERRRMTAKMRSEAGKETYKKRKETVEWPFGNIKHNLKFREFLTRGIEKVRVEHNLVCSAHNLKVIWGKLERNVPIISTIRMLVVRSVSKVGNFLRVHAIINLSSHRSIFLFYVAATPDSIIASVNPVFILSGTAYPISRSKLLKGSSTANTHFGGSTYNK